MFFNNLEDYFKNKCHFDAEIVRYDENIKDSISPDYIMISSQDQRVPTREAMKSIILKYASTPILGVSSGCRIICDSLSCMQFQIEEVAPKMQTKITCAENEMIFLGISNSFSADYCDSYILDKEHLPQDIYPIAFLSNTNLVISVKHNKYPIYGMGFCSGFLFSPQGLLILRNFLNIKDNAFTKQNMLYIRESIDQIDRQIVGLFSKRYGYVKEASKYKNSSNEVIAKDRIKDVLNKARVTAKSENIDPDFIEKLYDFIVHSFISFEMQEYEERLSEE